MAASGRETSVCERVLCVLCLVILIAVFENKVWLAAPPSKLWLVDSMTVIVNRRVWRILRHTSNQGN